MNEYTHEQVVGESLVKELALFLGNARFDAGLSQKELAELSGVKIYSVHSLENGMVKKPNALLALKLSLALDIDIEEFLGLNKGSFIPLKERLSIEQVDELKFELWSNQKSYNKGVHLHNQSMDEQEHYNKVKQKKQSYVSIQRFVSELKGDENTLNDLIKYSFNKSIDTFYNPNKKRNGV